MVKMKYNSKKKYEYKHDNITSYLIFFPPLFFLFNFQLSWLNEFPIKHTPPQNTTHIFL